MFLEKDMNNQPSVGGVKRITSNALILFIRILVITILNLYSVRFVLKGLGNEDYGVFYTVMGVVMTCSCIFPVLSVSVQRFYSFVMGRNEWSLLREIFSASINIVIVSLSAIIILLETIGLYFITTKLQIPFERISESLLIYHCAIITFAFSFLQIPYIAVVFAHEDMNIYAYISCFDCVLKLIAALLIDTIPFDRLLFYGPALAFISFCTWLCYFFVSRRYKECRYKKVNEPGIYKKLLSFSGWVMYGGIAGIGIIQGNNILLNVFFGPLANAAYGVANNVYNAFTSLSNSMILPFRPQMIKSYAASDFNYLNNLFSISNKFIFYVLCAVAIPIVVEMNFIMNLWLGDVSDEMINFSRLFIVYTIILTMHNPLTIIMQASGNIKIYHLVVETIMITCLPVTWFMFRMGYPPYIAFASMIVLCVIAHGMRLIILKNHYRLFNLRTYVSSIIMPGAFIISLIILGTYLIHDVLSIGIMRLFYVSLFSLLATLMLVYFIGLSKQEQVIVNHFFIKH